MILWDRGWVCSLEAHHPMARQLKRLADEKIPLAHPGVCDLLKRKPESGIPIDIGLLARQMQNPGPIRLAGVTVSGDVGIHVASMAQLAKQTQFWGAPADLGMVNTGVSVWGKGWTFIISPLTPGVRS